MTTLSQTLTKLGDRVSQLYTLPAVAIRVMELTDEPDIDVPQLKSTIENDPALTAKILRVVNSSLFSRVGKVADLNQALALLGIQPLKLLVLGFSLPDALFEEQDAGLLERYWRRSLTKAAAAREISRRFWHVPDDEAFIAGLLDDLGQLVLLQQLGERYVEFLSRVETETVQLECHENETLGFNHRQLSANLLRRWQLPETILCGIESPRDVMKLRSLSSDVARLPQVLHLAELVADALTQADVTHVDSLIAAAGIYRDIPSQDIGVLLSDVDQLVEQLAGALGASIGDGKSYHDITEAAHERLASVAEGALLDVVCYRRISRDREADVALEEEVWDEATALSDCLTSMLKWTVPDMGAASSDVDSNENRDRSKVFSKGDSVVMDSLVQENELGGGIGQATMEVARSVDAADSVAELVDDVASAVALCRAKQWSLSVVLFDSALSSQDPPAFVSAMYTAIDIATREAQVQYAKVCPVRGSRLAWILPQRDRDLAVELAREALDWMASGVTGPESNYPLGAGVASVSVPSKNFDPRTLVQSADRCLYAVLNSGGSGVKSIAVF